MSSSVRGTVVIGMPSRSDTSYGCRNFTRWMTMPGRARPAVVGTVTSAGGGAPGRSLSVYVAAAQLSTAPSPHASTDAM
jgi:hypothetical protein